MTTNKTVLVVDDDIVLARALASKLGSDGISVLQADNGATGLEMALEKKPDFIVLDVIMPNVDGMTMLQRLREGDWGKTVPVMLLTNLDKSCHELDEQEDSYATCFVKANCKIAHVVEEIENRL
jgi:DNA-binding response OmpR family regulator